MDAASIRRPPRVKTSLHTVLARGVSTPVSVEQAGERAGTLRIRLPAPPDVSISPSEASEHLEARATPHRRGRHVIPAVATRSTGPLGLAAWHHRPGEDSEVLVYPDLPAARRIAETVRRGKFEVTGARLRGPLGLGTDFETIRDYLPDDDIRRVNWRATARTGRPMTNQYRVDVDRDVICIVDCGRLTAAPLPESGRDDSAEGRRDKTRLDVAVDAAVAVAAVADVLDDRSGAVAFDSDILRRLAPRRKGARAVARTLFDVEPSTEDSDYDLAFRAVGAGKRAFALVLTDLLDETAARPLLEAVPVLARRHAVVVAGVTDPDLEGVLATAPTGALDAYRSVVALEVLNSRRAAAGALTRAGAAVIEAPAERLPAACVSAYLRAKARARL